jgi:D-aminopeptidase
MVSGDQVVAAQVAEICPWAEGVVVKQALGNQAGDCLAPPAARALIEAGAQRAVRRAAAGELALYRAIAPPYEFEVELREPIGDAMRMNVTGLNGFAILDDFTIGVTAPDMDLGFRRVAYLGYADRPGVTRH